MNALAQVDPLLTFVLSLVGGGATYLGLLLTRRSTKETNAIAQQKQNMDDMRAILAEARAEKQGAQLAATEARGDVSKCRRQMELMRARIDALRDHVDALEDVLRDHNIAIPSAPPMPPME